MDLPHVASLRPRHYPREFVTKIAPGPLVVWSISCFPPHTRVEERPGYYAAARADEVYLSVHSFPLFCTTHLFLSYPEFSR